MVQEVAHTAINTVVNVLDNVPVLETITEELGLDDIAHGLTEDVGGVVEGVVDTALGKVIKDEENVGTTAGGGVLAGIVDFGTDVIGKVFSAGSDTEGEGEKSSEKNTDNVKEEVSGNTGTEQASSLKSDIQEGVGVVQEVTHTVIEKVGDVLENVPAVDDLADGLGLKGLAHGLTEDVGDIVDGVIDTALGGVTEDEEGDKTTGDGVLAGAAGFVAGVISNVLGTGSDTSAPEEGGEKSSEKKRILQR